MVTYTNGFMLIEVMIYSAILVLLSVLTMSYAANCYMRTIDTLQLQRCYAQMNVTLDVLARDVAQSPLLKALWKSVTDTEHIWTTVQGDVGLENTRHGIIRSQGMFDITKKRWIMRTKSFFPPGMHYAIKPMSEDNLCFYTMRVTIALVRGECITTTVALRSGAHI